MSFNKDVLRLGIDVGSTTVKVAVMRPGDGEALYTRYERHHAEQWRTAARLFSDVAGKFPGRRFRAAVCGSGGRPIAERIGARYVQEVVANAAAVRRLYPAARTAVELGGQDAKIIFFYDDNGKLVTSDMRMNGSCAGGTGAFIDEIASLLKVPTDEFEALASKGRKVIPISGRCGVFAKTDIQSVLNAGGSREDIALSAFHAIVKQTVGGLAQGLELHPPIIFEGGPLTYNDTLVEVFCEKLNLTGDQAIRPNHPETIVALGSAIAVDELFPDDGEDWLLDAGRASALLSGGPEREAVAGKAAAAYFGSDEEREEWRERNRCPEIPQRKFGRGTTLDVFIGVDAGSTTSKMVFLSPEGEVIDRFYANNEGDPISVVKKGLLSLKEKYERSGVELNVLGFGSTGYGELLVAKAFGADYHTVETVAHAHAARAFVPDVSFILDIGGQDMKGIWVSDGIVTNITLNEACSSGCGSFLENFAKSLGIETRDIAEAAFRSKNSANLGSRCTVFMNSTIITEQKNGCGPDDIMAGLCRSIIENVFTKVVRITNKDVLGRKVVVQGGTFKNDAVLRALEQYLGFPVTRAPYPGEMGAIGAALLTAERFSGRVRKLTEFPNRSSNSGGKSNFIGFSEIGSLTYSQRENVVCSKCANHCARTLVQFSNGTTFITGNRCARGEVLLPEELPARRPFDTGEREGLSGLSDSKADRKRLNNPAIPESKTRYTPDLFLIREQMLFKKYPFTLVSRPKNVKIGLPRSLEYWDSMPFWSTFFRALGYEVVLSEKSTRAMFESGINFVPSDTVCFPAKLTHGHIQNLVGKKVDRIFMPMVMEMPPADRAKAANYVCAVVKGYPLIVSHSENPGRRWGVPFDRPMFHWYSKRDRRSQILEFFSDPKNGYGIRRSEVADAFREGERAILEFRRRLEEEGGKVIERVRAENSFAVVLAGRPYHNDALVSHDLSRVFTKQYIPVLTVDSIPGLNDVDLRHTRAEVTNNFHTRMLSGAMLASRSEFLEYVQIVSFGCGHDAILSDEITRIMAGTSGKSPLILKMDEGGAANSLNIRVKSFIETISQRRARGSLQEFRKLPDAYPAKFARKDLAERTVLVPNVSSAFCRVLSGILRRQGLRAEPLSLGDRDQIQKGKKYVHNDTCFPAQMVIGEAISALESGRYDLDRVAVGMAKYQGDCRLSHYSALLRRALDAAGFQQVPIVSTDPIDSKEMHPGFRLGALFNIQALWGVTMIDLLEELRRKIRPYELKKGETDERFERAIDDISEAIGRGVSRAVGAFSRAIDSFLEIRYDRTRERPRVFVTGEYLVTFHPGSNFHVERYLEDNGMEVILPRMANVFRKDFFARIDEARRFGVRFRADKRIFDSVADGLFERALSRLEKIASRHPLYKSVSALPELADATDPVMHRTFLSGEGWLIPGEIMEFAREGVRSFVILQPFGCLPNHICGRGIMKRVKEEFPSVQILPLDLDPDTSFANVENRLQMLIMNEKSRG